MIESFIEFVINFIYRNHTFRRYKYFLISFYSALQQLRDCVYLEQTDIHVSRTAILFELLHLYTDPSIVDQQLHVEFLGEPGDDFGGLTKELFTVCWSEATKELFAGENCVVPVLPLHRVRTESWKFTSLPLGRILAHTMALTGNMPPNLSRSFLVNLIFASEVEDDCLMEDFLQFVTKREKRLLLKSINHFDQLEPSELDRLLSFFTANRYFDLPRRTDIRPGNGKETCLFVHHHEERDTCSSHGALLATPHHPAHQPYGAATATDNRESHFGHCHLQGGPVRVGGNLLILPKRVCRFFASRITMRFQIPCSFAQALFTSRERLR